MLINDSYWSGKENGQSEAEKFWKKEEKKRLQLRDGNL